MTFPAMIALEYSEYDERGFPTAIAWTLDDGMYKGVLIQPVDEWLNHLNDDVTAMDRPVSELLEMGENLVDIARELAEDRSEGTLYAEDPELVAAMLERFYTALEQECPYEVAPMLETFAEWDAEHVESIRRLYIDRLDLSPHLAEQNILAWRAAYAHLMEEKTNTL
ncbi:hypothetical protein ACFOSD_11215 [Salinispirillum marinum]|uniref:Uncharacterized protein n=2 Tax=Saccharospirillaceae TaxID=255527 RepID=A0ABV8BIS4_9GAMM